MSYPLRAVYDNAVNRSTLSVTGAPQLPIQNLLTDNKNEVYRSANATLSVTFTATWFTPETISCVVLSPCNLSTTATMQVLLYSDANCTALLQDSGVKMCSEGGGERCAGLTAVQSASAYSYAGGTNAYLWLTKQAGVLGMKVVVTDTSNLQGYLEVARMIAGDYWAPTYNAEYGANVVFDDSTENFRTDAGNLLSDVGTMHKKLSFVLSFMQPADKTNLWKLVKYIGKRAPLFVSLYPENPDKQLEQAHTIYGKLTAMSVLTSTNYQIFSAPVEIEAL